MPADRLLAVAGEGADHAGVAVKVMRGQAEEMPFPGSSFDAVASSC